MPKFPNQYIIVGDENLKKSSIVSTTPDSDVRSKKTGPLVASENNEGDMTAFLSGTPTQNLRYIFRGQTQGSTEDANFVWKLSTEDDRFYKGEPQFGVIDCLSIPLKPTDTPNFFPKSIATVYSPKLNQEFVYFQKRVNHIAYSYRTYTRRGEGEWAGGAFNFSSVGRSYPFKHRSMGAACLSDGSILLAIVTGMDIDIYISENGRDFTLIAKDILETNEIYVFECANIQLATSGNYINISVTGTIKYVGSVIISLVSADNGQSWTRRITKDPTITQAGKWILPPLPESQDDIWAVGSLDDEGTFILFNVSPYGIMRGYVATGTGTWIRQRQLSVAGNRVGGIGRPTIVNGSSRVYLIYQKIQRRDSNTVGTQNIKKATYNSLELVVKFFNKAEFVLGQTKFLRGSSQGITSFNGSSTTFLRDISAFENPSGGLSIVSNLMEKCGTQKKSFPYFRVSGWDTMPLRNLNRYNFREDTEDSTIERNALVFNRHHTYNPLYCINFEAFGTSLAAGTNFRSDTTPWSLLRDTSTSPTLIDWNAERIKLLDRSSSSNTGMLFRFISRDCFVPSSIGDETAAANGAITNYSHVDDFGNPIFRSDKKSPNINWAFIPVEETGQSPSTFGPNQYGHGSLLRFICKASPSTAANGVDSAIVAGVSTYLGIDLVKYQVRDVLGVATTRIFNVEVRVGKDNVCLYDVNGGSVVSTLTPTPSKYGSSPFAGVTSWEFRLAIYPFNNDAVFSTFQEPYYGAGLYEGYIKPKVQLYCRRTDLEDWDVVSPLISEPQPGIDGIDFNYTGSTKVLNQMVYFGHRFKQTSGAFSEWKHLSLHQGNDFGALAAMAIGTDRPILNMAPGEYLRGRTLSSFPTPIADGLKISWGGSGIAVGDTFHMDVDHTYAASNTVKFESPRIKFQTIDNPSQQDFSIIYKAPNNKSFSHDSVAVFNTPSEKVSINYSNDSSSFTSAAEEINLSTNIKGRIVEVDNNIITVELSSTDYSFVHQRQFTSSNKKCWHLKTSASQSGAGTTLFNGPAYKIENSISVGSNRIQFVIDTEDISSFFPISAATCQIPTYAVGVTTEIYSDKGTVSFARRTGKYMKVQITGFQYGSSPYCQLGSIVAGVSMPFRVPLDWVYSDTETPNIESFNTRSGVSWTYNKGPAARTITLQMNGEIDEKQRQEFRTISRGLSKYGKNPLVLVTLPENEVFSNQGDLNDHILLSRFDKATDFKNDGWYYNEELGIWNPMGNMSLVFTEIV